MRLAVALLALIILVVPVTARTWYINPGETGDAPTIQAGIDSTTPGDTVLLADGVYAGAGNKEISFWGKPILLQSDSGDSSLCIIDCENSGRGFCFYSGEGPDSRLRGVGICRAKPHSFVGGAIVCSTSSSPTISNCYVYDNNVPDGAGIFCTDGASPIIQDCLFTGNSSTGIGGMDSRGAGVSCTNGSSPTIRDCIFTGNSARDGSAIWCGRSSPTIWGCIFTGNSAVDGSAIWCGISSPIIRECEIIGNDASSNGGGILCNNYSSPLIIDCLLKGNTAGGRGGAISCWNESSPTVIRCTIVQNSAEFGGGLHSRGASAPTLDSTIIAISGGGGAVHCEVEGIVNLGCCDLYENLGGDWVDCIADQYGINGNFSADPLFCDLDSADFTLDAASPCLNDPGCGQIGVYGEGCDVVTGIAYDDRMVPTRFSLSQNTPNPFNPTTELRFELPAATRVQLTVYDVAGRRVAVLEDRFHPAGWYNRTWDGRDETRTSVASGIYFARIQAGDFTATRKMVLLR